MDFSTIIGVVAAFILMIVAISSGGGLTIFIDPPSAMIVIGGTIGTTLVHYTFKDMVGTISIIKKNPLHPPFFCHGTYRPDHQLRRQGT